MEIDFDLRGLKTDREEEMRSLFFIWKERGWSTKTRTCARGKRKKDRKGIKGGGT